MLRILVLKHPPAQTSVSKVPSFNSFETYPKNFWNLFKWAFRPNPKQNHVGEMTLQIPSRNLDAELLEKESFLHLAEFANSSV